MNEDLRTTLIDRLRTILNMIGRESPLEETYELLESYLDGFESEDFVFPSPEPYLLADNLLACDETKPFPPELLKLIKDLYELSIADKNATAMNDLGALYYSGRHGFPQDFSKALYYYEMAAAHGDRLAQENLGYCYYYGRSTEVDYKKAYHYFALGALDGHLVSLYKLGDMYLNGLYVEKNEKEAFLIYDHCQNLLTSSNRRFASGPVHLRLGNCYLNGIGTEADARMALSCYQTAERDLTDMIFAGEIMYKRSLQTAIDGQAAARKLLMEKMPQEVWLDGQRP